MSTAKKESTNRRTAQKSNGVPVPKLCGLEELHLDKNNPRFGTAVGTFSSEAAVLDFIVTNMGVEDLLSSIAVNGYFNSEPILAKRSDSGRGYVVIEGNRRLVACLVLDGDARAKGQKPRTEHYRELHAAYGRKPYAPIPVLVFDTPQEVAALTPYLGVRYIAGAQPWDSYAKAAWIADAIENHGLALEEIVAMIGDSTQVAKRMLMAYYVAQQLIDSGRFNPDQSQRRGQKSNPAFPFSWVYTALSFQAIRDWLALPDVPHKSPLSGAAADRGAALFAWMFGQDTRAPAIADSREIQDLDEAIKDETQRRLLESGLSLKEVAERVQPAAEGLSEALTNVQASLRDEFPELVRGRITSDQADALLPLAHSVRQLSARVYRELERIAGVEAGDAG